jgi:hypothetical protein
MGTTLAGRLATVVLGLVAATSPGAALVSQQQMEPAYDRGVARAATGWVASGRDVLATLDDSLTTTRRLDDAIPGDWARRGFDQIGDVDVAGDTLYVPFARESTDHQAMARYDAATLAFEDATLVPQHANAFVAVDGTTGIAYSMDRTSGDEILRYDVRAGWQPIAALHLDRTIEAVRGGAVARDAVWLVTGDSRHTVSRVDLASGAVTEVATASRNGGRSGGVDAVALSGGDLHVSVADAGGGAVTLDHFRTRGSEGGPTDATRAREAETTWPPALVYFAIFLALAALGAVGTVLWRANRTLRPRKR